MELANLESFYPEKTYEEEVSKLISFVKEGKSAQLIALPGAGRANLLGVLAYNRNVRKYHLGTSDYLKYHFVFCNMAEVRERPLFDVMKYIFLELSSSLHERRFEEEFLYVDQLFKNALTYQDELVLFQALKQAIDYLALEKHITIVLLLERFETLVQSANDLFFTNLRSMQERAKYQFCVIFSTTRPLEDLFDESVLTDFYEFFAENDIYMKLLDSFEISFRIAYIEKLTKKSLSDKTKKSILELTGGHSKLTRLSVEFAFSKNYMKTMLEKNELLSQKTITSALLELWNFLTPDEQQDILHICHDGFCPNPNPFLQKIHLLKGDKIAILLFSDFVEQMKKTKTKATFSLDESTQIIFRNGLAISDTLTRAEYRLLRLLLQNENLVIDREHIIQTIWSDTKTQEGVSEQAIDQLIFRLRKKIEDDPNNPLHVQTIKGRGIKFLP